MIRTTAQWPKQHTQDLTSFIQQEEIKQTATKQKNKNNHSAKNDKRRKYFALMFYERSEQQVD